MASPVFFLLLLAFLFITATSQGQRSISLSDTLTPTSKPSWLSSSGVFAFGFYQRGDGYYVGVFLPGTPNKTAVRTYYRDDPPLPSNSTLRFDSSGRLVLQSAQALDRYVASPTDMTASASMLDSGNFILYNSNQGIIWQSFDSPTDTILGGQSLSASQELYSSASLTDPSTGRFLAIMQLDGVLALYPNGTPFTAAYGYWDSGTPNNGPNVTLHLEEDGFLYLLKPPGEYLKNFTIQGNPKEDMIYRMTIDPDGLLRLYSYNITGKDDWSVEWLAPTDGEDRRNVSRQKEKGEHTRRDILIAVVSSVAFAIVMLAVFGLIVHKICARVHVRLPEEGNTRTIDNVSLRLYTYEELKKVTNDFAEKIGKGAFGTVYKGTLSNSLEVVAVKKLEKIASDGDSEFQTEVKIIGRTHHRNLVKLLGYCLDGDHRLLVYEYMSNGSLADLLFVPERRPLGDEKMGIAQNIARGLLYLHEECETQIIHCDIKPQNILIDEHKQAKISDFGLSKLLKPDQTNTMTRIRGTRGYVAPEWYKNLRVTVKADVYSFGIMLLEIIYCRRNLDWNLPDEEAVLEEWVYNRFRAGELEKLVDDEFMDRRQLGRMVKVGLWCIQEEPSLRPSMKKVLLMLEGTVDIPMPPCPSSIVSAI